MAHTGMKEAVRGLRTWLLYRRVAPLLNIVTVCGMRMQSMQEVELRLLILSREFWFTLLNSSTA